MLAIALFALIASGLAGSLIYGYFSTSLAGTRERAAFIGEEGLDASHNIRDAAYTNLVNGTTGVSVASNVWTFSGASDTTNGITRAITIADAGSNRKQLTEAVTWTQMTGRAGSFNLVTYLTNWRRVGVALYNALLIYGDGTTSPKYRTYNNTTNVFSTETTTVTNAVSPTFIMRTSPTKSEAIAAFYNSSGDMYVMCFDGTTWTDEWNVSVGGTGAGRRVDVAYETASGDVMVLYSTNTATTNELNYRTKAGSAGCGTVNWSAAQNLNPVRTANIINYIRLAWDRRAGQNLIAATWVDISDDLSSAIWTGSAWTNEPATVSDTNVERVSVGHDLENMDIEYESLSGDVMMVWGTTVGNNANGVRYRTCNGGTSSCTWSAVTTPPTFNDDATNLDLSANPNTDQMVFASIGENQRDLQIGYWSGTTWTNTANVDTSCNTPFAGSKLVSTGWLINGATTRSVVLYEDQNSNSLNWYVGNVGVFTVQGDFVVFPAPVNPNGYYDIQMNPLSKDQLMFCFSDNNNDLFCKRLAMSAVPAFTWTNSDGAVLETTLPQKITSPFAFAYWRQ